jgi:hypothetical protein
MNMARTKHFAAADEKVINSSNGVFSDLRAADGFWLYDFNCYPKKDGLLIDTTRKGLHIKGKLFFSSSLYKKTESPAKQQKALNRFIEASLFHSDKNLNEYWHQGITSFATMSTMSSTMAQSLYGIQKKNLSNITVDAAGNICVDTIVYNIKIRESDGVFIKNVIHTVPGTATTRFILTDEGFKLDWIEINHGLLEKMCLDKSINDADIKDSMEQEKIALSFDYDNDFVDKINPEVRLSSDHALTSTNQSTEPHDNRPPLTSLEKINLDIIHSILALTNQYEGKNKAIITSIAMLAIQLAENPLSEIRLLLYQKLKKELEKSYARERQQREIEKNLTKQMQCLINQCHDKQFDEAVNVLNVKLAELEDSNPLKTHGQAVLAEVIRTKSRVPGSLLPTLTHVLFATQRTIQEPTPANVENYQKLAIQVNRRSWGKLLGGIMLALVGVALTIASGIVAAASLGTATPLSVCGITAGLSTMAAIGGHFLFFKSLCKPKLRRSMVSLTSAIPSYQRNMPKK